MIALPTYSGETAIFGLGRSGLAAVAALCAAGNRVVAWDDAEAPRAKAAELAPIFAIWHRFRHGRAFDCQPGRAIDPS